MAELITLEIQAEASTHIKAAGDRVWQAVADLAQRPNLTSFEPLDGNWPDETAHVRVIMDKGVVKMSRTETVIRCVPGKHLLIKIEAPEYGSTAWLDHRLEDQGENCLLTIGAIAVATFPEGEGPPSREEYARLTLEGLKNAVDIYRDRVVTGAE